MRSIAREQRPISVFDFIDYKKFIVSHLDTPTKERSGRRSAMARSMGCKLAYLSRVLNADADLSLEQAEAACRFLTLSKLETSYFLALVAHARAGTSRLREYWLNEITRLKQERRSLKSRISFEQPLTESQRLIYYSHWYFVAIHVCVGIESVQTPEQIAKYLRLPLGTVLKTLRFLHGAGLIAKKGEAYFPTQKRLHVSKESPLVARHHLNWKLQAMENLAKESESDLHYSSVVSISKDDFEEIRAILFELIEKVRSKVARSKDEVLVCYALDLFQVGG